MTLETPYELRDGAGGVVAETETLPEARGAAQTLLVDDREEHGAEYGPLEIVHAPTGTFLERAVPTIDGVAFSGSSLVRAHDGRC